MKKIDKFTKSLNHINTIFFDVDGVFTDGGLYFSEDGFIFKKFNVHDGMGCILLKELGFDIVVITARHSIAVTQRFKELGINKVFTKILNKRDFIRNYSNTHNLTKKKLAMFGDDIQDLIAIDEVSVFFTTANAIDYVKDMADYITKRSGGYGAVREICDLIISSKGLSYLKVFEDYMKKGN